MVDGRCTFIHMDSSGSLSVMGTWITSYIWCRVFRLRFGVANTKWKLQFSGVSIKAVSTMRPTRNSSSGWVAKIVLFNCRDDFTIVFTSSISRIWPTSASNFPWVRAKSNVSTSCWLWHKVFWNTMAVAIERKLQQQIPTPRVFDL